MTEDCVFCGIIEGRVPAVRVFEDADVVAFMDTGPVVKGHTLVVPKTHCETLTDASPEILRKLIVAVRAIAHAQVDGLGADGVSVMQANGRPAGQVVPHLHVHVIPRFENDGHSWNWRTTTYRDQEEMADCAESIRKAL